MKIKLYKAKELIREKKPYFLVLYHSLTAYQERLRLREKESMYKVITYIQLISYM